jgi:Family of unknown function (DUF6165)
VEPIHIPVSPGDLIDRITILELKARHLGDQPVHQELTALRQAMRAHLGETAEVRQALADLREVNAALWNAEDRIRALRAAQDLGASFVQVALTICDANDRRVRLKREVNRRLGSPFSDVRSYLDSSE